MSVTSSMWTGVSGLLAHGERMSVIGNNIANVNTVGFKGSRMDFQDFFHQDINSAAGVSQVGRGVSIGAIFGDFSQGPSELSKRATDLAIGGKGFFQVKPKGQDIAYYTRAGNFDISKDGHMIDIHGYVLQGWQIERSRPSLSTSSAQVTATTSLVKGSGAPTDIKLDGTTCEPQHTSSITSTHNLDARDGNNKSTDSVNPFFALFNNWNGTAKTPLDGSRFAHQAPIKVYDEGGTAHTLTIYFDQVPTDSVANAANGKRYWEYVVTMDPVDDMRSINGQRLAGTSAAGILMTGTLTFDTAGQMVDMTAFTLASSATGNLKDLSNWRPATFSSAGYPLLVANFSGVSNASYTTPTVPSAAEPFLMELNFGIKNTSNTWSSAPANAAAIGSNAGNLGGLGTLGERQSQSMTSYGGPSSMLFQKQDGFTFGFLQSIEVDQDGILRGRYSNGVSLDLYQITLYDFISPNNLRREGGNLFSETRASGDALSGPANANGYGSIASNSLEQSNVDLAREFVQMITTQRGFQSNSKVITTTDNMLETVVNMKR